VVKNEIVGDFPTAWQITNDMVTCGNHDNESLDKVLEWDFDKPEIKWFDGGKLNMSYNCLDRHLTDGRRNKAAIIWQGEP